MFLVIYTIGTAVKDQELCPDLHVPSHAQWKFLIDYLGGSGNAAVKLTESGSIHWNSAFGTLATNQNGFTALPGVPAEWVVI